jgi:hypothetical protein
MSEPPAERDLRRRVTVDITCDLMDEDETGYAWTFLRDARDPSLIASGAFVLAGDPDAPAVAEVVEVANRAVRCDRAPPAASRSYRGIRSVVGRAITSS